MHNQIVKQVGTIRGFDYAALIPNDVMLIYYITIYII